jgi:hypothetical protein
MMPGRDEADRAGAAWSGVALGREPAEQFDELGKVAVRPVPEALAEHATTEIQRPKRPAGTEPCGSRRT